MAATWSGKVDAKAEAGVKTGFNVKKGDAISIVAAGWVTYGPSDPYMVGPQGNEDYKRDTLVYPQAPAGSLLVNIGGTLYPVGSGKLGWPAPADGELVFLINDDKGRYGDNSGEFDVTVKQEESGADPSAGAPTWSGKAQANAPGGQSTGLTLKKGDIISVSGSGWTKYNGSSPSCGPQGQKDYGKGLGVCPDANIPALVMSIGNNKYPVNTGLLFWEVPVDGALTLLVNDQAADYGDNSGEFDVSVRLERSSGSATRWTGKVPANAAAGQSTGLTVAPGQTYSIVASAWAKYAATSDYHGPQGVYGSAGNSVMVCPQANAGELLAKVGSKYYVIGGGSLQWKPDVGGGLVLLLNDGTDAADYHDNVDGYDVTVVLNEPTIPWSGKVPATQAKPGLATGITLKKGDLLSLVASGFVVLNTKEGSHPLGPQGVQNDKAKGGALIMTIGDQTFPAYTGMLDWKVPVDGPLSFFVQDDYYPDNTGAFDVALQVKPAA